MFKLQRLGFVLLLFCLHGVSHALPQGGQIVGGSGSITQQQNLTDIRQHTQSLAINWNSFNLSEQDVVNFYQPSASSIALNRILSSNASQIFGQINANGRVVLVNSNGVFFGQTASVNVGGLIASGLDIGVNDFMNGDYRFNATDSADGIVKNSGTIQASLGGSVALLGKQVENSGYIGANLGSVALATGHQAVLSFDPEGLLGIRITDAVLHDELGVDPALVNSGEIEAAGGRVLLTASQSRDIFSNAVNHSSIEQATSAVVYEDGSFTLGGGGDVVNSGSISVSSDAKDPGAGQVVVLGENITSGGHITADAVNASGGDIELHANDTLTLQQNSLTTARSESDGNGGIILLLGQNVGLFGQSKVDASGSLDGGTVLMGGDQQGQNKYIRNAEFLYLGELTKINADSLDNGNGGKVIAFADDTARIYGSLSARGGSQGGDGGFIETSGKKGFQILSAPDVSAEHGTGGSWLIDPNNITIVGGNGFTNIFQSDSPSPPTNPFTTTDDGAVLGVDLIIDALMGNEVDVTITTANADADNSSSGVGTENGNITLATNLDFDGIGTGDSLTFNAIGGISINFNQRIEDGTGTDDSLNLNLYASGAVSIGGSAQVATNGGSLTVGYIDQNNSANNIIPSSFTNSGTINTSGLAGGDITISTSGDASLGSLDVHDTHPDGTTVSDYNGGGAILVNAGNDIIVSEEYDFNGTVGNLVGEDNTSITLNADNDINIEASIVDKSGSFWDTQNIILNADHDTSGVGTVNINANIYLGGGNLTVTGYGFDSSGYTINTDYSRSTGDNPTTNGGNVSLTMTGPVTLGSIITEQQSICGTGGSDICGNVSIKTGGAVSIGSSAQITTYGGGFTVEGWTDVASSTTYTPASFTMNSGSSISTTGGGNMAGGAITISTNIVDIGDPTLDGSIKITSLTANGGSAADAIGTSGLNGGEIKLLAEGDIDITGAVTSNGSVGDFHNEASAGYYGQNGGDGGAITLSSTSGSINVESTLSSLGGNGDGDSDTGVAADPANGGNGGEVKVTATSGTVSVAAISTRGGAAIGGDVSVDDSTEPGVSPGAYAKSGNGGNITIASGSITMSGNLDSRAGNLPSKGSAGAGGAISIQGDAVLASNIALNSNVGSGTNPPDVDGTDGSVTFTGTLNAQTSKIQTLDIDSGSINFQEIIGGTTPLGSLTLNATGVIDAGSNAITAASLFVTNSSSFTSGDIETSGTVVTGDAAGQNGGNITITSQDITVGALTTNGSDASGILDNNGGDGGAVSLTATHNDGTPSITLNGDINALGGGATGNGTVGSTGTKTISVNGSGSAEGSVIIGYTGIFTDSFTVAGNTSSDTLTGPTLTGTNSWDIDGEYDGTLNTKLTFTNFENLVGGSANDDFIFSSNGKMVSVDGGTGGTDSITGRYITNIWTLTGANEGSLYLQNGNSSPQSYIQTFLNIDTLSGNSASDTLQIDNSYNTALSWTINASGEGDLAHTFGGNGAISFTGMENLVGSPEVDSFTISDATASINIDGAGSSDSLIASSTGNNSWSINGSNSQTLVSDTSGAGTVTFTRIENLVGGALNDEFDFSGGGSAGSVTGNGGSNTIIGQNALNEWTLTTAQTGHVAIGGIDYIDNFSDIQILQGGTGTDTLTGRDVNNHWVIDVSNGNYVEEDVATPTDRVAFSEMENLVGGTSDDRFDFSAVGSVADINGNGGSNTIIGQNASNEWALTTAQTGHVSIGGTDYIDNFSDIQTLQGGTSTDTLTGRNVDNRWIIDTTNGGYVEQDVATPTDRVTFSEMENLTGGDGDDTFLVQSGGLLSGEINGGSESVMDSLQYSIADGVENAWVITDSNSGYINNHEIDFTDIESIQGNSDDDTFTISNINYIANIDGGNEDIKDVVDFSGLGSSFTVTMGTDTGFVNIEEFSGNAAHPEYGTLEGADTYNQWVISGQNQGTINGFDFSNFANLTGGTAIDEFTIDDAAIISTQMVLNGGKNTNSTDYDTLKGPNKNTFWTLDSSNTLADAATPANLNIQFTGFENLTAQGGDDSFRFIGSNTVIGTVDAGAGSDNIDLSGNTGIVRFNLANGFSRRVNFERVTGNGANSILIGNNIANTWFITHTAGDSQNDGVNDGQIGSLFFYDFANLTGGGDTDTFVFSDGSITGLIDGGLAASSVIDTVDLVQNSSGVTVQLSALADSTNSVLEVIRIDELKANPSYTSDNQLLGSNSSTNSWSLDGNASGTLNGVLDFVAFGKLTGQDDVVDNFTLANSAVGMAISGGGGSTRDTVTNAWTSASTWNIGDSSTYQGEVSTVMGELIQFSGFESLLGSNAATDTFNFYTGGSVASIAGGSGASYSDSIHSQVATDVIWRVDGTGSGEVNGVFTSFSGMEALYGGSGDDRFNMEVSGISIEIDGGANTLGDIVDYSGISVDTAVTVNLNSVSFTNIEQVKGNNNSTLIATNAPNSWLIDDENSGTLDGFRFVQFNKLTGGNDIDTFTVSGSGSLTGQINAGIGDDIINIALTPLYNGAISFVGGSGNDTLTVTGNSASTSKVTYSLLDTGFEQLSYSNVDATTYSVSFKETESVNDKFVASSLEINGGTGNDQIELGNQRFSVNSGADISFTGKTELVVDAAGDSDIIDLFEDIDMSGAQVSLSAESITTSNNAVLTADSLTLDTVASVGAASNYFLTNIDSLNLANVAGDVYLSNQGDLALTQFSTITGAVNLLSQSGGISNNVDIDENADLQLIAQNGDIDLQNIIHLQTLVLNGGNVAVNNGTHALSVNQINAASSISLISNGLDLIDSVSGSSLAISAGATEADIQGDVNISGSSGITATGITLSGDFLSGGDSQLNAGSGDINLQSSLTATGSANLTLTANSINQDSAIVSGAGDINLHAANTITMKTSVSSTAASGDIRYQADGGSIQVSSLTATQGTVSLLSPNGTIIDNNNNAVNVHADALVIESLGSIGSSRDDRFDTQVGGMDIVTTGAGSIWLNQSGDVEIIRLQATTGSNRIDIQSNANMLLNPGSVAVDRNSGVIVMATNNGGGILGNGTFDLGNPDITAFQGTFLALSGAFGSTGRPIVLDVPKTGEVFIQATTYGVMFSPETPDKLTKNGIDVGALGVIQSLSGEQLVEVETLGQVDPAIFTELRNYSIAEEPIRLPQDQSYEDDEEEANRVSLAL